MGQCGRRQKNNGKNYIYLHTSKYIYTSRSLYTSRRWRGCGGNFNGCSAANRIGSTKYWTSPGALRYARTHLPLKTFGVVGVSSLEVHGAVVGPDHPLGPPRHLRDHLHVLRRDEVALVSTRRNGDHDRAVISVCIKGTKPGSERVVGLVRSHDRAGISVCIKGIKPGSERVVGLVRSHPLHFIMARDTRRTYQVGTSGQSAMPAAQHDLLHASTHPYIVVACLSHPFRPLFFVAIPFHVCCGPVIHPVHARYTSVVASVASVTTNTLVHPFHPS